MSEPIKILMLPKYSRLGASSRLRSLQYLPWFNQAGLEVCVQSLLSDSQLQSRYRTGGYGIGNLVTAYWTRISALLQRRRFDMVWIEKEALPWLPLWLERWLLWGVPYVLDYDDAIFHNYDQHPRAWVRRSYGRRLDGLMKGAALVIGGNNYLAQRARGAGAQRVEVVPTVIDLQRYLLPGKHPGTVAEAAGFRPPRIVWIGSPTTAHYLQLLREPLRLLAQTVPFTLRVIGGGVVDFPGVAVESLPWTEDSEAENIRDCDVGVMPLLDSPWERGKCGYKLIQYMACGLPVVASAVGANLDIVEHDKNGFVVSTSGEWVAALEKLLCDAALRMRLGKAGRLQVEQHYCIQQTGPHLTAWLTSMGTAVRGSGRTSTESPAR